MANEQNLIPFDERSKEEAREFGRKGGVASGAARRRKRSLKEAAELYMAMEPTDKRVWNALSIAGIDPEDIDNQMAVVVAITQKAMTGDTSAARVLIDLLGESTKDRETEQSGNRLDLNSLSDEQLKAMVVQEHEDES